MSAALRPDPARTTRLVCHAVRPGSRHASEKCGAFCGHAALIVVHVGLAKRAPDEGDGTVWAKCPNARCGLWNQYRPVER